MLIRRFAPPSPDGRRDLLEEPSRERAGPPSWTTAAAGSDGSTQRERARGAVDGDASLAQALDVNLLTNVWLRVVNGERPTTMEQADAAVEPWRLFLFDSQRPVQRPPSRHPDDDGGRRGSSLPGRIAECSGGF